MMPLWTKAELKKAIDGEVIGNLPDELSGVSIDSRTVKPNEIFFCIKGEKLDGHVLAFWCLNPISGRQC